MIAKRLATGLIGSALLVSAAYAAEAPSTTATGTNHPAAASTTAASYQGDWRASKIVGLNVYNNNNEKVGDINDVLMDKTGSIKAVVIGVGGFLGMGEHLVAVQFDKIKFMDTPVASTSASNTSSSTANRPASTTTTGAASNTTTTTSSTSSSRNQWYPDHAVFNATKDELKAMPEFKWNNS